MPKLPYKEFKVSVLRRLKAISANYRQMNLQTFEIGDRLMLNF